MPKARDDELRIVIFDDARTLDPHDAYDSSSRQIVLNVYEGLLQYDDRLDLTPCISTSVPVARESRNGDVYEFPIRRGVRDHSGREITPDDVTYSLRRMLLKHPAPSSLWLEAILGRRASPELVDIEEACERIISSDSSVLVVLREPFSPFLHLVVHWSPILSRDWAASMGEWDGDVSRISDFAFRPTSTIGEITNGTGPYEVESIDRPGRTIRLKRFDHYWDLPGDAMYVSVLSEDDGERRVRSLLEGGADFAVCAPETYGSVCAAPGVVTEELVEWSLNPLGCITQKLSSQSEAVGSGRFDGKGFPRNALSSRHLRLALAHSFDHEGFVERALYGRAVRQWGPFPQDSVRDSGAKRHEYDLDRARHHLSRAWGGEAAKGGFTLRCYTHRDNAARVAAAEIHAEAFNRLNPRVRMVVQSVGFNDLLELLYSSRCPLAWLGWDADYRHPYAFAAELLDPRALLPSRLGHESPRLERLVTGVRSAGEEEAEGMYRQIAEIASEEALYLFVPGKVNFLPYLRYWEGVRLKNGVSNVLDFSSFRRVEATHESPLDHGSRTPGA